MSMLKVSGMVAIMFTTVFVSGCTHQQRTANNWWKCPVAGAVLGGAGGSIKNSETAATGALGGAILGGLICAIMDNKPDTDIECPIKVKGWDVKKMGCPKDSDGDGVPDVFDKCPNTPPGTLVGSDGCPVVRKVQLKPVHFEFNSDTLTQKAEATLIEEAVYLKRYPTASIHLTGYTDSTGPDEYNLKLSERRASAAKAFLIDQGVNPSKIIVHGEGKKNPVDTNATREGRKENRRVETEIQPSDDKP